MAFIDHGHVTYVDVHGREIALGDHLNLFPLNRCHARLLRLVAGVSLQAHPRKQQLVPLLLLRALRRRGPRGRLPRGRDREDLAQRRRRLRTGRAGVGQRCAWRGRAARAAALRRAVRRHLAVAALLVLARVPIQARPGVDRALLGAPDTHLRVGRVLLKKLLVHGDLLLHVAGLLGLLRPDDVEALGRVGGGLRRPRDTPEDVLVDRPAGRVAEVLLVVEDEGRLGHRKDDEVGAGVDRPRGAGQAPPAVLPRVRAPVLLGVLPLDLP
mmetsp:Transcript_35174/g.98776  ORF Transcript_35174/g.98776 Transcript_35174/m.98776 type:complete len:269 (-) Transcript_35174:1486-2292(-)